MTDEKKQKAGRAKPDARSQEKRKQRAEASARPGDERIARRLARAGIASRREAEAMIAAGRVKVNGRRLSSPAINVLPSDRIEVDGEPIPAVERTRLFLFHTPAGVVTTLSLTAGAAPGGGGGGTGGGGTTPPASGGGGGGGSPSIGFFAALIATVALRRYLSARKC